MFRKDYREVSLVQHLIGWTFGLPIALFLVLALPAKYFVPEDTGQFNTWVMVAVVAGLLMGPIFGVISWAISTGLHGWAHVVRKGRKAWKQSQYQGRVDEAVERQGDAYLTQQVNEHLQESDPWEGTNPYGCCQHNYDEHGVLHHGSPDCEHPTILAQRH